MKCPNCGSPVAGGGICRNCGVDAYLYQKTLRISDALYNKGLAQAKAGDLSGAAENLNKCVYFNKENIQARNLLGLVYFEFGRVGDALKQWVISLSILKKNNIARNYVDEIRTDDRAREWYSSSLKNYNQALTYLQQKSEDLAIIQLRRAVEQNPKFVDALNLLALCHLILKEKEKAAEIVEKVLTIDVNNTIALNYYREIYPNKSKTDVVKRQNVYDQKGKYRSGPTPKPKKNFADAFHIAEIISFFVGCACIFGLCYFLIIPGIVGEKDAEILSLNASLLAERAVEPQVIEPDDERLAELSRENDDLRQKIGSRDEQIDRQGRIIDVYKASNLQRRNEFEEAAAILFPLDVAGLPVEIAEMYENLAADVLPKAVKSLYDSGVEHFNQNEYEDAVVCLERANLYVSEEGANADAIIYYLGFTMEMLEDADTAIKYYNELIEDHPGSNFVSAAQNRLQELTPEEPEE